MSAKPSPPRIPKGSKEGGRIPKWAAELRGTLELHDGNISGLCKAHGAVISRLRDLELAVWGVEKIFDPEKTGGVGLWERVGDLETSQRDLRDRLGTSTPLIIWNIAVLIVLFLLIAKVYDVGHFISGSAL